MKIAVIAFNHPESSLPLAKYLADNGNQVDYYYITDCRTRSISAFDFSRVKVKLGITTLKESDIPEIFDCWKEIRANLHLIRYYWLPFKFFPFVKRMVQRALLRPTLEALNAENYEVVNLIGQDILLKYIHEHLTCRRIVHSLHEVAPHYPGQDIPKGLIKFLLSNKVPVIVHSHASYKAIKGYSLSKDNPNIHEIPFGLFETYLTIPSDERYPYSDFLLFYGRIVPYKGLGLLSQALEILKDRLPDLRTVVAGEGNDGALDELRSNPQCILINRYLSNEDLVELNVKAKAIVCPYQSASQSGIVQTSFAFNKPVIATSVGAFTEVITDEENGLLVEHQSPAELADAILRLFTDGDLYAGLVEGVRQFSTLHPEYDWNSIARQTAAVFGTHSNN